MMQEPTKCGAVGLVADVRNKLLTHAEMAKGKPMNMNTLGLLPSVEQCELLAEWLGAALVELEGASATRETAFDSSALLDFLGRLENEFERREEHWRNATGDPYGIAQGLMVAMAEIKTSLRTVVEEVVARKSNDSSSATGEVPRREGGQAVSASSLLRMVRSRSGLEPAVARTKDPVGERAEFLTRCGESTTGQVGGSCGKFLPRSNWMRRDGMDSRGGAFGNAPLCGGCYEA